MPVIIPDWYGSDWIQEALRDEDIMLAGSAGGGVFTLFGQPASPAPLTADATAYTIGVQFSVSQAATLTAIWFYSAPGAAALPQTIALFTVSGQTLVHSESPTWSGAAGSGWVRAGFSAPPALTPATQYKACVLQNTSVNWYSGTLHYWDTGAGAGGITSGPLTAPNNASSAQGQDTFNTGFTLTYPATTFNANNNWIDPEVSTS